MKACVITCEVPGCNRPAVTHVADTVEVDPEQSPVKCASCKGTKKVGNFPCLACNGTGEDGAAYSRWEKREEHHFCEDHARTARRVYNRKGKR